MVATRNITDLNSLVTPQADDILLIVDRLSSTSTEAKQITWGNVQEAIQDIVGALSTDTTSISFTYDDASATLTADVVNNTSTQKSIYSDGGTPISTRQEANFVDGVGINVDVADDGTNDRANITVKNTGVVNASTHTATGTTYEFLSSVTVEADGSKTLELRPLKLGSSKLSASYTDSNESLTIDVVPGNININDLDTTTPLGVSVGGTGANNAATGRNNLGAAKSGSNSDITALNGLTTALSISQGGTGDTTADAALANLQGLNAAVGVGAAGEQIVYQSSTLVSGSYRAEFKGLKPTSDNFITVATDGSDLAFGANPNNILDGISGARNINGARITNAASPVNNNDLATKAYVDAQTTGLDVKASVRVATTGNLAGTYAGAGQTFTANSNGAISIDGVSLNLNDRLLLKDQSSASQNGIYTVTTIGNTSNPFVLTRAVDFNTSAEVSAGAFTYVESGTANLGKSFIQTNQNPVLDTSDLDFSLFGDNTIGANSITDDKLATVAQATVKGRAAGTGTGNVTTLSADQLIGVINQASSSTINQGRLSTTGLAPIANPTFTGTVTIPSGASISGFAKINNPTFTGTVTIPTGANIAGYAPLASPTFTGTVTIPSGASIAGYAPIASPTFTGTVTIPAGASISGFAKLGATQTFTAAQRGSVTTLTDNAGGSVTPNFASSNNFSLTLTGTAGNTRTLANPTNMAAGQSGVITVTQSSNGSNLLTFGSYWDLGGATTAISTTLNAVDTIAYYCVSTTKIRAVIIQD